MNIPTQTQQLKHLQFSGHETFPIRYGWLKKAYDATYKHIDSSNSIFNDPSAIALFGVGKNMVSSMRHWATQCKIIPQDNHTKKDFPTNIGHLIFGENGYDPYMENPSTLWLIHWFLASNEKLATWYWVFNKYHSDYFERETLTQALIKYAKQYGKNKTSSSTIKRDVECFVRTYTPKSITKKQSHEDALESPLTELGLIKPTGKKDGFRLVRGIKPSLGDGVFSYAVSSFFNSFTSSNTISLEALLHQPGSPGRIFQLNEDDLIDRLIRIENITFGNFKWSETAGLKQLIRTKETSDQETIDWLAVDYEEVNHG